MLFYRQPSKAYILLRRGGWGEKKKTSGKVSAPVSVLIRPLCVLSHFSHPPLCSERRLAAPLIGSRAAIIGPLRSQKDTQHECVWGGEFSPRVDFQVGWRRLLRFLRDDNKHVWKEDAARCCALIAFGINAAFRSTTRGTLG